MAVFRVERNRGYTVMNNHHLRNKELTLKAKGLLSQMLSLPEDWDYTLARLSHINRESIDAIRTAVWELEKAGYITRRQGLDEKGKMTAIEYTIYEQPQPPLSDNPALRRLCPSARYPFPYGFLCIVCTEGLSRVKRSCPGAQHDTYFPGFIS